MEQSQTHPGSGTQNVFDVELGPPLHPDGTPLTPREVELLAERQTIELAVERLSKPNSVAAYLHINYETDEFREAKTVAELESQRESSLALYRALLRHGQLSPEEWQAPSTQFDGFRSLLCELAPDYDHENPTLGDLRQAAYQAIIETAKTGTHPKSSALLEAAQQLNAAIRASDSTKAYEAFYIADIAIGASEKWRVSDLDHGLFIEEIQPKTPPESATLEVPDEALRYRYTLREYMAWREALHKRRHKHKTKSKKTPNAPVKADTFSAHTSEEWSALTHLAADAPQLRYLVKNEQRGAIRHQRPAAPFFAEMLLMQEEIDAGHGVELIHQTISELDFDDALIWLYTSHLLAPPGPLPDYASARAWINLDDVARKTLGGYARSPKETEARRAKVYNAIRAGARAHIGGKRSTRYIDKQTGQEIETELYTSPWKIMSREEPAQLPLWKCDAVPLRVELVASREWTALTTGRDTTQYLPFAEVLGAIPGDKAGGAWARSLGLAYLHWCRINPRPALDGAAPTRRQLLEDYPAKVAFYREVLDGNDPRRALTYWRTAEDILRESGLIEALPSATAPGQRQGWQNAWLAEHPAWTPAPSLRGFLEEIASKRFEPRSRQLNPAKTGKSKRKAGRPKKNELPDT